jgi:protein-tyrosine phosphatase
MEDQAYKDIPLKGIQNFRDAGAIALPDGSLIREGLLYRSGQLENATAEDIAMIRQIGIKCRIDLRPQKEHLKMPRELQHIKTFHLPVDISQETIKRLQPYLKKRNVDAEILLVMESIYKDLVEWIAPHLQKLISILADADNYPLVIHCRGGKDRTGAVVACVHDLLGISRERILENYTSTNQYLLPAAIKAFKRYQWMSFGMFPAGNYLTAYTAHEKLIRAFLKQIDTRYGDSTTYLLAHHAEEQDINLVKNLLIREVQEREEKQTATVQEHQIL